MAPMIHERQWTVCIRIAVRSIMSCCPMHNIYKG